MKQLKDAAKASYSISSVLNLLGLVPAGGNYEQVKRYFSEHHIDISHFTGRAWNKGRTGYFHPQIDLKDILVKGSSYQSHKLKRRLFQSKLKKQECELCGWCHKTVDGYLPLELDHINGNHSDNRLHNLRILCPNCHSLQPTYRGRKRGDGER